MYWVTPHIFALKIVIRETNFVRIPKNFRNVGESSF